MANKSFEENALETRQSESGELQAGSMSAAAMREIEVRVMLAKRFRRDEEQCYSRLMKAMAFPNMAARASYIMPWLKNEQTGKPVSGASVHLARAMASIYGNMTSGNVIVALDDDGATVRGMAWDLESNYMRVEDVIVPRRIPRKVNGVTELVIANSDQLMRSCANYGGRKERNCLLRLFRQDIVDDALEAAGETKLKDIKADPDAAIKKLIRAFDEVRVSVEQLQDFLGHKIASSEPEEIQKLREIFIALREGEAKWADYAGAPDDGKIRGDVQAPKVDDVTKSEAPNRGHDDAGHKKEDPKPEVVKISADQADDLTAWAQQNGRSQAEIAAAVSAATNGASSRMADVPASSKDFVFKALGPKEKLAKEEPVSKPRGEAAKQTKDKDW